MNRPDYRLLYVLSEPPVQVAKTVSHGWKTGDVLLARNDAASSSEWFLILDVSHDGQVIALQLSETSNHGDTSAEYICLGSEGLGLSERGFGLGLASLNHADRYLASQWVRVDRVYFEPHITGTKEAPLTVLPVGSFSEPFLSKIKQALTDRWLQTAASIPGDSTSNSFEDIIRSGYDLQRFLDLIQLELDGVDYALIREFLHLPAIDFKEPEPLDCDCEAHQAKRNSISPHVSSPRDFLSRTWLKMIECAKKLELQEDPIKTLENLKRTSVCLGCQRTPPLMVKLIYSWPTH
jgi:hypothetical protein